MKNMMTVAELKRILDQHPGQMRVMLPAVHGDDGEFENAEYDGVRYILATQSGGGV